MSLVDRFTAYSDWRNRAAATVEKLRAWLESNRLGDAQGELRLKYALDRLREDQLTVAFVAEFSRGKSELINAIFFADYGDRILPSSAGRTTMCPTELQWSPGDSPSISLLPIETRASHASVAELKRFDDEWQLTALDSNSARSLQAALTKVGETKWVPLDEAEKLGFAVDPAGERGLRPGADNLVEIPSWRHAIIRFPHPLLEKGLVVLDTPGLNAIGAEPELTLSLLPNAHAVLFVLAADTGVTQSDLAVWREYVDTGHGSRRGRLVALNKIDGLWDGLRDDNRINQEIDKQVVSVAQALGVPQGQVFPISAQKALVSRINGDVATFARSRLATLETALVDDLLPTKQEIVRDSTLGEADDLVLHTRELLNARLGGIREQLHELTELRGKNQSVIEYMMRKVKTEKDEFEQGLQKYYAVRSVFSNLTNSLLAHLGLDALRDETRRTRQAMLESSFSKGLRGAMLDYFASIRGNLQRSTEEISEITKMLEAMYKRFSIEHGLKLSSPNAFSTLRYQKEIDRLEQAFNSQFNTVLAIVTTEKHTLTQKFFETIAVQARKTFEVANRDVENWLRAVMAPLETQVREYQLQLKRRLESVKRIHQATDTLEDRIVELQQSEQAVLQQLHELAAIANAIHREFGIDLNAGGTEADGLAA